MLEITIHNTEIIEWLSNYDGPKFHAVLSDPPYGLSFMGKSWDKYTPKQYQKWVTEWSSLLLEHLYPSAVCMFFGGTRTYHRLATGLEDAGFEIFDSMIWCYGSGFPKSYNISKAIDKTLPRLGQFEKFAEHYKQQRKSKNYTHNYICEVGNFYNNHNHGGASTNWERGYNVPTLEQWQILQPLLDLSLEFLPLVERIELERKKIGEKNGINGSIFRNYDGSNKTGSKTIDITENNSGLAQQWDGYGTALKPAYEPIVLCRKPRESTYVNSVLDYGTGALNIDGCRIGNDLRYNQKDSYTNSIYGDYSQQGDNGKWTNGRFPANFGLICECGKEPCECIESELDNNASRFFYTAKASRKERSLGTDKNNHPTVKPIKLTEYLAKLILPPIEDSSILIPFSGSGSEVIGAMLSKWCIINALEIDENYCTIAQNRVDYWKRYDSYEEGLKDAKTKR